MILTSRGLRWVVAGLALFSAVYFSSSYWARLFSPWLYDGATIGLASWALPFFYSEKPLLLIRYALSLVGFGLFFIVWTWFSGSRQGLTNISEAQYQPGKNRLAFIGCLLIFVVVFLTFYPFIFGQVSIFSEFPGIEEKTLGSGQINNLNFLEHTSVSSSDAGAFAAKNNFNITWQVLNRGVLHHHNFVLGPIHQLDHGRPLHEINTQYGILNLYILSALIKALDGGISFQSYMRVLYGFYPLYFILLLAFAWMVFREKLWIVGAAALGIAAAHKLTFFFILLGPGLNPIRHLFDLFAIGAFWLAIERRSAWLLMLCFCVCLLGILNNAQTGLILFLAGGGATTFLFLEKRFFRQARSFVLLALAFAGGLSVFVWVNHIGNDLLGPYYLKGLLGMPIKPMWYLMIVSAVAAGYVLLALVWQKIGDRRYGLLFLFLYCQGLMVYGIWGGTLPHYLNFAAVYGLTGVMMLHDLAGAYLSMRTAKLCAAVFVALCLVVLVSTSIRFYTSKTIYDDVFRSHVTYDWPFKKARIRSTMDPEPFRESIALIERYSDKSGIWMFSKYESLLALLANKYNSMPVLELAWFLITPKEESLIINAILKQKPRYLFVDNDIKRDFDQDVVSVSDKHFAYLHDESIWRSERYKTLWRVFKAIAGGYAPKEQRGLITVYERRYF